MRRRFLNLAWLLLVPICASTATAQYRFDSWTEENGLPQSWVKGMRQTRDGYLWITTGQGVARFDGVRFKVFNRVNTPALTSDRFSLHAIYEDHAGNLWMGTEDGGVISYRDGVFNALTSAQGLPGDSVIRIDEDSEGTVWIITSKGVASWKNEQLTRVTFDAHFDDSMLSPPNTGEAGKYFGLWRKDGAGWQRFASGKWSPFPLPPDLKDPAQLQMDSLVEDSRGRVWYHLHDRTSEYYRVENGQLTILHGFNTNQFVCYEDAQGRLWLSGQANQSALLENGRITPLTELPTSYLYQVLEDREGNIWVGTLNKGLFRLKRQVVTVYVHPGGPQFNNIQPLMQDRGGNVWTGSGGLARLVEGRFQNFYHEGLSRSPTFDRNVLIALGEDSDGSFWLGVRDGIVHFRDGRLERNEELSSQIKAWVHTIHRDRAGNLWFGSEQGLYCLRDGRLTRYGKQDGLPSDDIRVLHEDRAGTLWIGTVGGLARRTPDGFYSLNDADGVAPARISALYEDAGGVLWVGTYDGVLYRLATDSGKSNVMRYATEQGFPYDSIHTILEDDQGFFWIGGQRGIYRIHKGELNGTVASRSAFVTVTRLGKEDGLLNPSCNSWGQPAGFKARDGKLWFPTEEGVAVIDPTNVPFNPTPPPLLIEQCLVDRQAVAIQSGLRLNPNQENLEISYTALSFIKPEQIRFRYKLEGLDQDWIEAGDRRTAYYSHIPPGYYTFKVIAANSDGVWNTEGQSLNLVVLPPFYRTWWFYSLVAAVLSASLWMVFHYRVAQLQRRNEQQQIFSRELIESQEEERKRIAVGLHDSLGQQLLVIKNWAMIELSTLPPENQSREALNEISETASQAVEEVREIIYDLRPYQLDKIGLANTIRFMVEKVAAAASMEFEIEIGEIDNLFSHAAEITLYRIVQECVNNIIKHAHATAAKVVIERDGSIINMTIADNGRGFDSETGAHWLSTTDKPQAKGFGLTGIAERVRMLGGKHTVQSAPEMGTKIHISIEIANAR